MPSSLTNIGRELIWLDPSAVGLVIALFVAALAIVIYLYLRERQAGLVWRIKASVISALISGTVAAPFLYLLSNCLGVCGL